MSGLIQSGYVSLKDAVVEEILGVSSVLMTSKLLFAVLGIGGGDEDGDGIFPSAVCTVKVAVLEFDFKDGAS